MKRLLIMILAVLISLSMAACTNQTAPKGDQTGQKQNNPTGQADQAKTADYQVKVTMAGKELKSYTIEDIKKMPTISLQVDGKEEVGPSVASILKDAGVETFSKVTFKGAFNTQATLTKEQMGEDTMVDLTNHNTVKLATKAISKNDWIKDIIEIAVE